jgi:hypothetical protein
MVAASFLTGSDQLGNLAAALIFLYLIVGIVAGAAMLNSWLEKRSRRQLPPQPRQRGEGARSSAGRQARQRSDPLRNPQGRPCPSRNYPEYLAVTDGMS